jgi:hypothetical protein
LFPLSLDGNSQSGVKLCAKLASAQAASAAKLVTRDEARRIAMNFAELHLIGKRPCPPRRAFRDHREMIKRGVARHNWQTGKWEWGESPKSKY